MDLNDTLANQLQRHLDALAAGDRSASDRIVELCSDRMQLLVERMLSRFPNVRRWEQADDVFQEATIRFLRSLDQMTLATPRDLMAIAITQIKRVLLDMARHHSGPMSDAANHASVGGQDQDPLAAVADGVSPLEHWTALHEAIEMLPELQREVFHLVWYMGADQHAIATLLGISTRTVKRYWRDARDQVRQSLASEPPEQTKSG